MKGLPPKSTHGGSRPNAGRKPKDPSGEKAVKFTVYARPRLLVKLDDEAQRSGRSRSAVVVDALEAKLSDAHES